MTGPALTRRSVAAGLVALTAAPAGAQPEGLTLDTVLGGEPIRLVGARRFAGAISSVVFRGREHVNASDHGRLFQSAIQFGGLGECLNPTQAGASRDRRRSSSRLLSHEVEPGLWRTTSQMAWWNNGDDRCVTPESRRGRPPRTLRSDVLVTVEHRFAPSSRLVATEVTFSLASARPAVVVEALTLYAPAEFAAFHHLAGRRLVADDDLARPGERAEPRILSTADGRHAVALLSSRPGAGFGRWRFADTSKLNIVFRPGDLDAGHHRFACAWTVGSRDEVAATIRRS